MFFESYEIRVSFWLWDLVISGLLDAPDCFLQLPHSLESVLAHQEALDGRACQHQQVGALRTELGLNDVFVGSDYRESLAVSEVPDLNFVRLVASKVIAVLREDCAVDIELKK